MAESAALRGMDGRETRARGWLAFALSATCSLLVVVPAAVPEESGAIDGDCSAIVLNTGGQTVFGCNYDRSRNDPGLVFIHKRGLVKTGLAASTTGVVARWTAKYASVVFSLLGYQHAWAGMNERGLTFSTMALDETVNAPPDGRAPLDWLWPQYLLDTCESVRDVIATAATVRTLTRDHYLFADRQGGVAVIEFLDGRMVAHSGSQLCAPVLTNSVYASACDTWQAWRASGNYSRGDNSLERFCLAADRVEAFPGGPAQAATDYAFSTLRAIYLHGLHVFTRWTIVFDTANLRAYFKTQTNPAIRWIDLPTFDLRCHAPALMLDINAGVGGDVSPDFGTYDSDVDRTFMEAYFKRWYIPYDAGQLKAIVEHFDAYACERPPVRRRLSTVHRPSPPPP